MSIPRTLQLQNPPLKGADVDQLQVWLEMDENDGSTRFFGGRTHQAVKDFKTAHRLRKDGTVNDLTWNVIEMNYRNNHPPKTYDFFHVSGTVKLLDLKTNTTQNAVGYMVRAFHTDNNPGIDPRTCQVFGEGVTDGNGVYDIKFRWPGPPPPPPPPPVLPQSSFYIDVAVCIGDVVVGHPQLTAAALVNYVYHTPPMMPDPPYGPAELLPLMSLPLNIISGQFLHRTNSVNIGRQVSAEEVKLFYYLVKDGVLAEYEFVPAQAIHVSPPPPGPPGATTYHFSYAWPPAGVTEPVPDLRVRAYRGGKVVGETPIIFNARKIEDDVNLDLPMDGVTEVPELNRPPEKSDFEILRTEIEGAADEADLVAMAALLGKASSNLREATVRYIAGDLVIDRQADPPPTDDADRAAYEQNTQQKITQKAGPVDRALRACEMERFSASYPVLPGAVIRDLAHTPVRFSIPVGPGSNRSLPLLITGLDPIPARYFFALLSNTPASVATSGLYDAAVMRSTDSQRETILMAHKNRVIDILPLAGNPTEAQLHAEMNPVLAKLAALRDAMPPPLPWSVLWSAISQGKQAVLKSLLADSGSWAAEETAHPSDCNALRWQALTFGKGLLEAQLSGQDYPRRDSPGKVRVDRITDLLDVADDDAVIGGTAVKGLRQHLRDGCSAQDPTSVPPNQAVYLGLPERADNLPIRGSDVNSTAENLLRFIRSYLPLPWTRAGGASLAINAKPSTSNDLVAFFQLAPDFSFKNSLISDYAPAIDKACQSDPARQRALGIKLSILQILGDLGMDEADEAARNWLAEELLKPNVEDVCRSFHKMTVADINNAGALAVGVTRAKTILDDLWRLGTDNTHLGPTLAIILRRGWKTHQDIKRGPSEAEFLSAFPSILRGSAKKIRDAAIAKP